MVYKPYRCQRQDGLSRPANSSWSRPECGFGPEPSARREAERRNAQMAPMLTRARDGHAVLETRGAMVPCVRRHVSPAQLRPGSCRQLYSPAILVPGPTRPVSWLRAVHATNHEREMKTHGEMRAMPVCGVVTRRPGQISRARRLENLSANCSDAMRSGLRGRGRRVVVTREARGDLTKRTGLDSASVERAPNAEPSSV